MKAKLLLLIAFVGFSTFCFSQKNITWDKWNWLIGDWVGQGSGEPGKGGGSFFFKFDLEKNILIRKSHSEYPATKDKPAILHEDLMIVYSDNTGDPGKAIYFDNEGHLINYTITYAEKTIRLTSDKTGYIPAFRLTYTSRDDSTMDTRFEMSQDGEKFVTYIEGRSKKK